MHNSIKHKNIMIVGTASNVGKSLLTAGLCRIFYKDGYKVSPFKSQNMALNSYITEEGFEIGRAQAVQAEACGIEAKAYMNPILLKPTGEAKSQVILNGRPYGNLNASNYFAIKSEFKSEILKAYETIKTNYDICVLEGAGSPAEINLKSNDIVNMGMAEMVDAPAILVGDIDRGGVFASIYGTVMLLEPKERERIKGVIINKFRGDIKLLEPGLKMLEELIKIPVLGVIPYAKLDIEDEDSLSSKLEKHSSKGKVKISVIRLKYISNFTDMNPLYNYNDVSVNYISNADELGDEDIIIIPGTKNTIEDMKWIWESGIGNAILKCAAKKTLIFGICGGLQMLGESIKDETEIEGESFEINGLALFNITTKMEKEKQTTRYSEEIREQEGVFSILNNTLLSGYEIHHGVSTDKTGKSIKYMSCDNIFGTYVHGLFENGSFTEKIINYVKSKKGFDNTSESFDFKVHKEKEFDKLEKLIRDSLDINAIYAILGEGK